MIGFVFAGMCIGFVICTLLWVFSDGLTHRDVVLNHFIFSLGGGAIGYLAVFFGGVSC